MSPMAKTQNSVEVSLQLRVTLLIPVTGEYASISIVFLINIISPTGSQKSCLANEDSPDGERKQPNRHLRKFLEIFINNLVS